MNMRLKKVLDDIQKTENKILELQEHVRQLRIQKKQMESWMEKQRWIEISTHPVGTLPWTAERC